MTVFVKNINQKRIKNNILDKNSDFCHKNRVV